MEVDTKAAASESQARQLAQKKRDLELEMQGLEMDRTRAARDRQRVLLAEKEKTDRELVEISKAAEQQVESVKKMNIDRVRNLDQNSQKHYEELSQRTADELKHLDTHARQLIEDRKASSMEKIRASGQFGEDPFYHMKTLSPVLAETEKEYTVTLRLPEHEAKNLFVSGEGPYVKLSLARRFQEDLKDPETKRTTKTNSFQTVVEQIAMPGPYDPRGMKREYADGVVTVRIPKPKFEGAV